MLKHKIGPYSVVDGFLCCGSQQILNPAMAKDISCPKLEEEPVS